MFSFSYRTPDLHTLQYIALTQQDIHDKAERRVVPVVISAGRIHRFFSKYGTLVHQFIQLCSFPALPLLSTRLGAVRIRHSIREIATQPVILWILLGDKTKWLPLNFGFNDVMPTAPIALQVRVILGLRCREGVRR